MELLLDFPREEPELLRELPLDPLDFTGELLRDPVFCFTLLEERVDELRDLLVLVLLRGATVSRRLFELVLLSLRLFTVSRRARVDVLRSFRDDPVVVPEEFQTRVLRLRCCTDLVVVPEFRVRPLSTLALLSLALPVVWLPRSPTVPL